jgi:hypothetical protein
MHLIFIEKGSNRKEYFCKTENLFMKSRIPLYFLSAVLFLFVACTKELSRENKDGTGPANSDFYATIDGKLWNADSLQLIDAANGAISILGLSKTGEQITMSLPTFKTGSYTLNDQSTSIAAYSNLLDLSGSIYLSNFGTATGTVTISIIDTINHVMSGSFQFILINPGDNSIKTITKGVFDLVPYVGASGGNPPPVTGGSDTLQAVIDGNNFNAAQVEPTAMSGQLFIGGISSDQTKSLALVMPVDVAPGVYNLDFASGIYLGAYTPGPTEELVSQSNGTMTIISNDASTRRIIGTFSFKASSLTDATSANITNGYFSVNY